MLNLAKAIFAVLAVIFLLAPLLAIMPLAFTSSIVLSYPVPAFSLRWFEEIFGNPVWLNAIINSLIVGFGATILATVLGTVAALGLRSRLAVGGAFDMLFLLPMIVPTVVTGLGMQIVFTNLGFNNSYPALIIAHAIIAIPFVIICVSSSMKSIDRKLEFAALSLNASPLSVFLRITLPLSAPGIAAGGVLAFATSLDEVVLTMFVSGPAQRTLARQMFSTVKENISPAIAAAAFLFILATLIVMLIMVLMQRRYNRDVKPSGSK